MKNGMKKIGEKLFSQMRANLICMGQMEGIMSDDAVVKHFIQTV